MPSLSQITNNFFVNLVNRLGVRPPPPESFLLSNVVQPVSIVDSDIVIPCTVTTQLLDAANSAGPTAAPAAGTVLADTGPLPAGTYLVFITMGGTGAIAADPIIERRNAANAANVWRQVFSINANAEIQQISFYTRLLLNERIRVEENSLGGGTVEVNIWIQNVTLA